MKQRYNELDFALCEKAVIHALDGKWKRGEVLAICEKYGGVPRQKIFEDIRRGSWVNRNIAVNGIALELWERMTQYLDGDEDALDVEEVVTTPRRDGMTGKVRDIARLGIWHQIYGHLAYFGLEPLLRARILPNQYASIPGRGQTGMLRKIKRCVRSKKLGIRHAVKTDVHHAYGTTMYERVIELLRREIPGAAWIIRLMEALMRAAPGGHLIIGGYIDAWLFNFVMSYALRYIAALKSTRRGRDSPMVKMCAAYMDDFGLMGSRLASLRSAAKKLNAWLRARFRLELKRERHEVNFLSVAEEKAMRSERRNPPGLDMGGYVVHKTYTSIRRRIYRMVRRTFLRAGAHIAELGTIRIELARSVAARAGYFRRTNTRRAALRLRVAEIVKIAKGVIRTRDRYFARLRRLKYAY